MLGKSVTLFELLGFEVKVDLSWVFLALLITWSLAAGYFPAVYEGLAPGVYWWMGIAGMIGLFFSLIFHELSHSLVARRYGLPIKGITLFIFGGVAEMTEEPVDPKTEFLMAVAGPIASLLLAVGFYLVAVVGASQGLATPAMGVARHLALLNAVLAGFNLVPAFPLDGGRMFRAALWYWKGDLRWATRLASRVGAGFGLGLIALGVLSLVTGNLVGGIWWALIGLFVRGAAIGSYQQLVNRHALEGVPVKRFMTVEPVTVAPELTLDTLIEDYVYRSHHDLYPVVRDGELLGCVPINRVRQVPAEERARVTVRDVMIAASDENTIDASLDSAAAFAHMQRSGQSRLMVTEAGRLVGIITLRDLLHVLSLRVDPDERP